MNNRKFVHIDMDAFFVSVEIRDNPSLLDKPVAVGGKSSRRGVLSTCNYIARQYGVGSAMSTALALKKCPGLVVVPSRMDVYKEVSQTLRRIFEQYTDKIEPLSLDEAYLDLTDCTQHNGSATLIAQEIREKIFQTTGLTASAGIAPLKFVAKIASDLNKPNGQCTIAPNNIPSFLESLPLRKIPGVGKVTSDKLQQLGFETCGDIRKSNEYFLANKLGKYGHVLWNRSHGIDTRGVQVSRVRKSVGVERTFEKDINNLQEMMVILIEKLIPELKRRFTKYSETRIINKLGVKVKFQDFQLTTKEQSSDQIDIELLSKLLTEAVNRGQGKAVRLLGVHLGLDDEKKDQSQLDLSF